MNEKRVNWLAQENHMKKEGESWRDIFFTFIIILNYNPMKFHSAASSCASSTTGASRVRRATSNKFSRRCIRRCVLVGARKRKRKAKSKQRINEISVKKWLRVVLEMFIFNEACCMWKAIVHPATNFLSSEKLFQTNQTRNHERSNELLIARSQ